MCSCLDEKFFLWNSLIPGVGFRNVSGSKFLSAKYYSSWFPQAQKGQTRILFVISTPPLMQNLSSLIHTQGSQDHSIQISTRSLCVCVSFLNSPSVLIYLEVCSQHTLLVLIMQLDQGTLEKTSFFDQSEACHEPGLRKENT